MKKTPLIVLVIFIIMICLVFWVMLKRGADQDLALKSLEEKGLDIEALPKETPMISTNERDDTIRLKQPQASDMLASPLEIVGEARGIMFFEGSFPIELLDSNGHLIARTQAKAEGEWMTNEFVPFTAKMEFNSVPIKDAKLVFMNDNPSGDKLFELRYEWEFSLR